MGGRRPHVIPTGDTSLDDVSERRDLGRIGFRCGLEVLAHFDYSNKK
jgi:hypothetical protein